MKLVELQIGDSLNDVQLNPVTRLDLIKYAGASGDFNPIHTIDEDAKNAGLPGIIAHGMWTMGNLTKLFTPFYQEGFIQDYVIRFRGMVFLNDTITLKATLTGINENALQFNVMALNQTEDVVIKGNIVFKIL
ncbi:MaoC/PaaZ C-terminal domain-containing protein [Ferdinandcohnia quinoae]|uniref:Dehydratase n=1 Tax=Fredinandcohnia quinoae TaxID=2918902 RepID=A0AAW5E9J5_9BACI|nr:MaoC/PaaZ C-terminal domain-containing protein [Fredinandcohnia sp. SECRCQ15]MCH1626682.1 dehydratase [Fredinandcohnia sp. SECRCQ15]